MILKYISVGQKNVRVVQKILGWLNFFFKTIELNKIASIVLHTFNSFGE